MPACYVYMSVHGIYCFVLVYSLTQFTQLAAKMAESEAHRIITLCEVVDERWKTHNIGNS